jgi:hypothetical protein
LGQIIKENSHWSLNKRNGEREKKMENGFGSGKKGSKESLVTLGIRNFTDHIVDVGKIGIGSKQQEKKTRCAGDMV